MPPKKRTKKDKQGGASDEAKITDSKDYKEGDVSIVSSDNVRFKVDKLRLMAASSVWRAMLEIPQSSPSDINLSDRTIETSAVLKAFFDLMLAHTFPVLGFESDICLYVHLAHFAEKYDCPTISFLLRLEMKRLAVSSKECCQTEAFVFGAATDDSRICEAAIRNGAFDVDPHDLPEEPASNRPNSLQNRDLNRPISDLSAFPLAVFALIPYRYVAAFQRASSPYAFVRKPDNGEIADAFTKWLKIDG